MPTIQSAKKAVESKLLLLMRAKKTGIQIPGYQGAMAEARAYQDLAKLLEKERRTKEVLETYDVLSEILSRYIRAVETMLSIPTQANPRRRKRRKRRPS